MEGKLVASTITRLAERDSLNDESNRRLRDTIRILEQMADGLGFCLSEDGDLLSQWRGYAGDATGVAIGFSTEYLKWLSEKSIGGADPGFTLQKVEYDPSAHESHIEPTYREVRKSIDAGAFKSAYKQTLLGTLMETRTKEEIEQEQAVISKAYSDLLGHVLFLFPSLFRLKAYAFRDEREWRLLSYFVKAGEDRCSHRVTGDRIIPYRKVEFVESERIPIAEVVLGPKHSTPPSIVEDFLKQNRYSNVRVRRSAASYR